MKKSLLALAVTVLSGMAGAQSFPGAMPGKANIALTPVGAGTPSTGTAAARPVPLVNPFNGKSLSAEQIQRELEQARLQTQMLEEQLKQTNLAEELKSVPLRKAVEAAQAATAVKKEEVTQKELTQGAKAALQAATRATAEPIAKPAKKRLSASRVQASPTASKPVDQPAPQKAVAAPAPRPKLLSIIAVGTSRSVVLEAAGGTLVVSDGETSPWGPVRVLDEASIDMGGQTLRVHGATMARFVNSDKTVEAAAPAASTSAFQPASASVPKSVNLPVQANGPLPPLPLPPTNSAMPSLQLPPGVDVLPAP